jgi:hypothetical protein
VRHKARKHKDGVLDWLNLHKLNRIIDTCARVRSCQFVGAEGMSERGLKKWFDGKQRPQYMCRCENRVCAPYHVALRT